MKFILISLFFVFSQGSALVVKNNGDQIRLSNVELYQTSDQPTTTLVCEFRGEELLLEINDLKRMNLKESMERKKGITTWNALLITNANEKYEVLIDFIEIRGINQDGKEESYSSSIINKISF